MTIVIIVLISLAIIATFSVLYVNIVLNKKIIAHARKREKRFRQYHLLENLWIKLRNDSIFVEEYFKMHGMSTIAIYGMDEIGSCLAEELAQSTLIHVSYVIDKNAYRKNASCEVRDFNDDWEPVDVIVVADPYEYITISSEIKNKTTDCVVSLYDILVELKNSKKS